MRYSLFVIVLACLMLVLPSRSDSSIAAEPGAASTSGTAGAPRDDTESDEVGEVNDQDVVDTEDEDDAADEEVELELDLEKLFPERSFFGPSARGMAFSIDGRAGGYLYRPYNERRHGADLWLYDTQTGEARRITSATVMAKFQQSAREVTRDRIKKARKAGKLNNDNDNGADQTDQSENGSTDDEVELDQNHDEESNGDDTESTESRDSKKNNSKQSVRQWGDWVSDEDAEDTDAPRYAGIQSFTWSPTDRELLFVSGGDIYRLVIDTKQEEETGVAPLEVSRLTKTNGGVRDVQYWPDGSGYTYMQGGSLMKVMFGSHLVRQLDPDLPRGESMTGYRVSPDGQRMVFLTSRTRPGTGSDRTVTIVDYRDRFARAREVRRTVSDDPQTVRDVSIYLYEIGDPFNERSKLARVFTDRQGRPRDVIRVPRWSPDSSRVAFSIFEQESSQVAIYEASLTLNNENDVDLHESSEDDEQDNSNGNEDNGDDSDDDRSDTVAETDEDEELSIEIEDAREIYRFLHYGGPNTPRLIEPFYLADSRRLVFISEQSGFRQLYRLDPVYQALDQLTRGRFEIYSIDVCKDHRWMFAWGTAEHATRQDVYRICLEDGGLERLTTNAGRYLSPAICPKGRHVLANFVTYGQLPELVAISPGMSEHVTLTDSHPEEAHNRTRPKPEFFTYRNRHGHTIHGKMFKPDDWTENDNRPLLVYVYGGPLSSNNKQVIDGSYGAPNYFFAYYMAKKHGYITVTIDPRGTSGYGGFFEKSSFEQVGQPQTQDLVDGVKWLIENHGVDENRVGLHGWSFGGFQTQHSMYTEPDVFHVGIAGAGPTEWHNYNSWYSTGTIGGSRTGQTDLEAFSLLPLAKNLKGQLLLVHGMEDANVLYQDTVKVYAALLEAGKETHVDLFLDPTGGHGLGGLVKTLNRYRKYEDYLLRHLGTGSASSDDVNLVEADNLEQDEPETVEEAEQADEARP